MRRGRTASPAAAARAFPLDPAYRPSPRDSLLVVFWSGNSIEHPGIR